MKTKIVLFSFACLFAVVNLYSWTPGQISQLKRGNKLTVNGVQYMWNGTDIVPVNSMPAPAPSVPSVPSRTSGSTPVAPTGNDVNQALENDPAGSARAIINALEGMAGPAANRVIAAALG